MGIAENIKNLRDTREWTQEQLAKKLAVTRSTVTQWETGWSQPRMGAVQKLAKVFNVPITEIISDHPKTEYAVVSLPQDIRLSEIGECYNKMNEENKEILLKIARLMTRKEVD